MPKKKTEVSKKVVTIYVNNPHEPMIRVCLDNSEANPSKPNEFRQFKNSLMSGVPGIVNNPVYATTPRDGQHALQDPKKGLQLVVSPRDWSHFYTEDYNPLGTK